HRRSSCGAPPLIRNFPTNLKPLSSTPAFPELWRPAVRASPAAFCLNAAVLNHAAVTSARDRLGLSRGSPTRSARSLLFPSRLLSFPDITVNGAPLRALTMADTPHPFRMVRNTSADPL